MASSSRGRDRGGDYRPPIRRSRSPGPPKRRSYSPPMKRKASPPADVPRRQKISKSPVVSRGGSRGAPELRYNTPAVEPDPRGVRNVPSERFRDREYEDDREDGLPQFRGPEGSVDFDINELKKFKIKIERKPSSDRGDSNINRNIINPDDIAPVRRPDEGSRPLFLKAESRSSRGRSRGDDYQRVVAIDTSRGSGNVRAHSRERPPPRYSPHYEDHRKPFYNERERGHSPYEARHRSPHRNEYVEPRDKHRERRGGSREDFRREPDIRKREERRYSPDRRLSYEREQKESDLRSRINEKRNDPHPHHRLDERERERRFDGDRDRWERQGRPPHSSPPRDRRWHASPGRHEGSHDRREGWEREGREKDSVRPHHSRERDPREHSDHHYEESRRPPPSHKNDYEPVKFFKNYEAKEFIPPTLRGRGLPIRRGIPPMMRGRGFVRGMSRGFRGGVTRGNPRGAPFPPRGFPPRKSSY